MSSSTNSPKLDLAQQGELFLPEGTSDRHIEMPLPGVVVFRGRALPEAKNWLSGIRGLLPYSPFRFMRTPGGKAMSVSITSCGECGWVSDSHGYRYEAVDPLSGKPWPEMPSAFAQLAHSLAADAGYPDFHPDTCLINRYRPTSKMSLHQDNDEADLSAPIVSISFGLTAVFVFGGVQRDERPLQKMLLHDGDGMVFGGKSRLRFHGVQELVGGSHPLLGRQRLNLTFRKAL
ncbi:MAG: DNA oxidative demethylase AlkB [bacterium]